MRKVMFISVTEYNLNEPSPNLAKKFESLSSVLSIYTIARGKPLYKNIWNCNFYLIPTRLLYFPVAFVLGCYLCITKKIDTIICQGPLSEGFMGVLLKTLFGKELIIEIHGDWREGPFINKKRLFTPILKKIVPIVAHLSFSRADKIRGVSEYLITDLKKRYSAKHFFVFPTFSDLDIFLGEKNTSFQKYICTAAVLSPIKNTETLIQACAKVFMKFPEFKLIIAGDGPSKSSLELKVENLSPYGGSPTGRQLTNKVVFTGRLSQEEVKSLMKDCYVFVLPSLSEGLPRVVLEAMALGKPVIASNVGGIPEIIKDGENGFLIEPKDTDALAEKMAYLINNPDTAQKMGGSGQKFVQENFSNKVYTKNYINMLSRNI